MPFKYCRSNYLLFLLLCAVGTGGQDIRRGDSPIEPNDPSSGCSCSSAITASVFITTIVVLIFVTLWWCYSRHRARKDGTKPDPNALSQAAYDNPYFQGDDLDQPDGGQTRINAVSTSQPTHVSTSPCPSAKVKTTATNTTGTLERGKTTLERVINAVIGSSRSGSAKRTKDDSFTEPSQVTVPLQGHDFTGLGFTVHGNLKEGLYVKEVMSRGPASQSGLVLPGDRVIGFTVLTDHIVFEDALTILTYASPYPVLLHLEKGKHTGGFSGTTTSKGKLQSTSAPSLTLTHPSFKSQSHEDLHKIKTIDVEKLKIGTIVPLISKGKTPSPGLKAPSPGLKHELPKIQNSRNVQRSIDSRHSERAIDVPGVEIRSKVNLPSLNVTTKPSDIKVDIDGSLDDKVELASVEVHRPMSSTFELEATRGSINLPVFTDANLSVATEPVNLDSQLDIRGPKLDQADSKTKFGIKVLPDISFPKRLNKKIDIDLEKGDSSPGCIDVNASDVRHENETNLTTENSSMNFGVNVNAPYIDKNMSASINAPTLEMQHSEKKRADSKFGFGLGFKGFNRDKEENDERNDPSGYIDLDDSNIVLPKIDLSVKKDESESDHETKNKKSKHGFITGMPEINLPSFGRRGSEKSDSPEIKDEKKGKSKGFKFDLPDFNIPSFGMSSEEKKYSSGEIKGDGSIKIMTPDFDVPSVDVKSEFKAEANLPKFDNPSIKSRINADNELSNDSDKSKMDMKLHGPNIRLPSLGFQTKGLEAEQEADEREKEVKCRKSNDKQGFKLGFPDVNLPSFNIKGKSKSCKDLDSENDSDNDLKQPAEKENIDFKSKFDMNLGMPDINLPPLSFGLNSEQEGGNKIKMDEDSSDGNKGFSVGLPDIDLKLNRFEKNDPEKDDKVEVEKSQSGLIYGLNLNEMDVNFPELNSKDIKSIHQESKIKLSAPDIPSVKVEQISEDMNLKTNLTNEAENSEFGIKIKGTEVNLPSVNFKSKKDLAESESKESDDEIKNKKDKKKHKEKLGFNFKFPNFSSKGEKHSKQEALKEPPSPDTDENEKNIGISVEKPKLNMHVELPKISTVKVDSDTSVDTATIGSKTEHEKQLKKSKFGINFKASDLSMPSVHLRGKKKEDISVDPNLKMNVGVNVGTININQPRLSANMESATIETPDLKKPSFDINVGNGNTEKPSFDAKLGSANIQTNINTPRLDTNLGIANIGTSDLDINMKSKDTEIPNIKMPRFDAKTEFSLSDVDVAQPSVDEALPNLGGISMEDSMKFNRKTPEFSFASFDLPGARLSSESNNKSLGSFDLEGPKISNFEVKTNLSNIDADIDGPDFEIPSLKMDSKFALGRDDDSDKDDDKIHEDKSKFYKINLPEFSLSSFGSDAKEFETSGSMEADISKTAKADICMNSPEFSLPVFKLASNKDTEVNADFNLHTSTIRAPDVAQGIDVDGRLDIEKDKKKKGFGFDMGFPDFNLPDKDFRRKDADARKANTNYSLPDELKAEAGIRGISDFDIHLDKKEIHFESPDLISKDFMIPPLSSPDLGFEDEKCKSGKVENSDSDGKNEYDLSVRLPDLTMPKFHSKSKVSTRYEDESSSKNISLDSNLPDIDTEFIDDDISDELNITDATKKKRFGFKIKAPDLPMPDFKQRGNPDERSVKVSLDGNQSDEVKSLNLKLNAPLLTQPETEFAIADDNKESTNLSVKLPRVKLPAFKSKLYVEDINLDKSIGDSGYSDQGENRLSEADLPSPKYSSGIKLFGNGFPQKKYNESDEWKIKGSSGAMMPSLNFNINSNDECPEDERDEMKYRMIERDIDFNAEDPDFVIPDFKTLTADIPNLELDQSMEDVKTNKVYDDNSLPGFNLNFKRKEGKVVNEPNINLESRAKYSKFGPDSLTVSNADISLDSSYLEMESDLPEADSDLQKASIDFPVDIFLMENMTGSAKTGSRFGNAFGFQGFKKHIEIDGLDSSINAEDSTPQIEAANFDISLEAINKSMVSEDLPESDLHIDMKSINRTEGLAAEHKLPKEQQPVRYSIKERLDAFEKGINANKAETSGSETETTVKQNESLQADVSSESGSKMAVEEDDGKGRLKGKMGLGFGFKGFVKSSEWEENDMQAKVTNEAEGDAPEVKDKSRMKAKKTFSFKAFGRSSSDTDEESTEKVSDKPMVNIEPEEKVKLRNKNSLTFGFKHKNSRNSDSEDNCEIDKVEVHPQNEGGSKKQKMKFGFMSKSKSSETEHSAQQELSGEKKELDDEAKLKSKNLMTVPARSSKEMKYDTKSESEGGEDEKMTMDSRGEDGRSKSRYGLNFGFRKNQGKTSSDSEGGENDEHRVNLNERGSSDKKEPKSKSLKLGFKGFKNLKGKIQSEINKMRHESPSSDDDVNLRDDEEHTHGEKRKKVSKKKDKDKKHNQEAEGGYLDTSEEAAIASAASAAKENRRSRMDKKSSSPSSSSDSSSDSENKSVEVKKKKKIKVKRKEDSRIVPTGLTEVDVPVAAETMEVNEEISSIQRNVSIKLPTIVGDESAHVTVVNSEPFDDNQMNPKQATMKQHMEVQSSPRRYVVVREMKLKSSTPCDLEDEVVEVIERVNRHREIPPPVFPREENTFTLDANTNGAYWGSDSDMEKSQVNNGVSLSETSGNHSVSGKQRSLTDSEELKRRAASLGDLSRLHEGSGSGNLLERAVSLDFKNETIGHSALHIRRLQLPDSSATSIDEADEPLSSSSPKKLELSGGLKAASQWGTLEEALRLGISSNEYVNNCSSSESSSTVTTTMVKTEDLNEGGPISNIEISGDRGSSVTALSIINSWNDSFEDEKPPSLPSSPVPIARTTITVKEEPILPTIRSNDSNVVVLGSNERFQNLYNIRNVSVEMKPTFNNESLDSLILSGKDEIGFYSHKSDESDKFQQGDDSGIVTVTMIPADSYPTTVIQNPPPVPPKPKASRPLSSPPELVTYENVMDTTIVTISHDRMHENGDVITETSDHNLSDEFVTPDSTPQKSMTQITLEGDGGYTVTEGPYSRTVIISNPDSPSPVSIVQTDRDNSLPYV